MKFLKRRMIKATLALMTCAVLFCGCTKNSDVVMKINDQPITRKEYKDDFDKIKNVQLKNAPKEMRKDTSYAVLSIKATYINDLIVRTLLNQEFEKRKITASDDEIKAKEKKVIAQLGSEEQFRNILKENNISDERLKSDLAQEVKAEKLVQQLGVKEVTDSEAQTFYNKNKEKFNLPERARVSHILINTDYETIKRNITDADKTAKLSSSEIETKAKQEVQRKEKLAQDILAKVKANPNDFAKLAQEYSEDEISAKQGGDLGYITKESVVGEFGQAAFTQKIGVVGPLVKTQFGQHIILVKDRAAKGLQPYNQVKNDIKAFLSQQKKLEAVQGLMNNLKKSAKIEFIDESLKPENIEKQLDEALRQQIELQQKSKTPKSKQKELEKMDNK